MINKIQAFLTKNQVITRILSYILILQLGLQQKIYFNYVAYRILFVLILLVATLLCGIPAKAVEKLKKENIRTALIVTVPILFIIYYYIIGIGKTFIFFRSHHTAIDILLLAVFFILNLIMSFGLALYLIPGKDENSKKHLVTSFLVVSSNVFLITLYIPIDTYIGNIDNFEFSCKPFILYLVFLFLSVSVIFSLIISKLKDKMFKIVTRFLTGLMIGSVVQYMFMNKHLPYLDKGGDLTVNDPKILVVNTMIWILIIAGIFILSKILKEKSDKIINIVGALLLAFHVVSLVMLLCLAPGKVYSTKVQYFFDNTKQYELSSDKNIIVITFDGYDNSYAKKYNSEHPEAFEKLKDFTMYTNTTSTFDSTATSVNQFLGNCNFNNEVSLDEYMDLGWNSEETVGFYDAMHKAGYECNSYCFETPDSSKQYGRFDNVSRYDKPQELEYYMFDLNKFHKDFIAVSYYRSMPYLIKNAVSMLFSDETFRYYIMYYDNDKADEVNYDYLNKMDYTCTSGNKFYYTHLRGIHQPCDTETENKYCFMIMYKLIDELKEQGVYDSSTIIFMADHGFHKEEEQYSSIGSSPLFMIKEAGAENESMRFSNAPISLEDFMGTIAVNAGIDDPEKYGTSIYDFNEDSERTRVVYEMIYDPSLPNIYSEGHLSYMIKYNAFSKYEVKESVEEIKGKDPFTDDVEILPMKVYFG